ncbi:hypothetical protein ElyMa_001700800 [Elysia marginata]|uniref:CBM20 domain-containing protein n=1 Tax=Elysia marginata TaxID=1093978 RepID=A0AAV4JTB4_9GAST|nr:hypothetical protein ElyMa_001700800 [Elysia marginata]
MCIKHKASEGVNDASYANQERMAPCHLGSIKRNCDVQCGFWVWELHPDCGHFKLEMSWRSIGTSTIVLVQGFSATIGEWDLDLELEADGDCDVDLDLYFFIFLSEAVRGRGLDLEGEIELDLGLVDSGIYTGFPLGVRFLELDCDRDLRAAATAANLLVLRGIENLDLD